MVGEHVFMDNRVVVMVNMGLTTITDMNISEDHIVSGISLVNTSLHGPDQSEHLDYWALPIFIVFITCGVFGNFLVCLAISTNR